MWETLTSTTIFGGGMATAYPTATGTLSTVEKQATKRGKTSPVKPTTKQSTVAASLSTTMTSASTMIYDDLHYQKVLNDALACVESMTDQELENALIAIGELEGEVSKEDITAKSI